MKKHIGTVCMILMILTGLSLLLYPTVSNMQNRLHSSQAIRQYADSVEQWENRDRQKAWDDAVTYNQAIYHLSRATDITEVSSSDYLSMLNVDANGMMGYVDIPKINCTLPIYHGTEAVTLENYVGHLPSSSLPVGGGNTHCVLIGHTGMPSARLLTDLDKLTQGDTFTLRTLERTLTYEVDRILVVEPDETEPLRIEPGKDYCTLVTCTPYGVNTHRLLVRGHRIENTPAETARPSMGFVDWLLANPVVLALAALLLLLMMTFWMTRRGIKREQRG